MKGIIVSKRGRNFEGSKLTEDNLKPHTIILYDSQFYETGQAHYSLVELYQTDKFICTVNMCQIRLVIAPQNLIIP